MNSIMVQALTILKYILEKQLRKTTNLFPSSIKLARKKIDFFCKQLVHALQDFVWRTESIKKLV